MRIVMCNFVVCCLAPKICIKRAVDFIFGKLAADTARSKIVCIIAHASIFPVNEIVLVVFIDKEIEVKEVIVTKAFWRIDIDIQVDGDGQHDPSYVPELVKLIEGGASLAIGSRFLVETDGFQSTFMRRVGIRWLSFLLELLTGKVVTDPTSGFRACNKDAIDLFCKSYPDDYPEPESIALAMKLGLPVMEAPVKMNERQGGRSSIGGFSSVYYMIKVTLAIVLVCWVHRGDK